MLLRGRRRRGRLLGMMGSKGGEKGKKAKIDGILWFVGAGSDETG